MNSPYNRYVVTQVVNSVGAFAWGVFFVEADGTPRPIETRNVYTQRTAAYRRCKALNEAQARPEQWKSAK